MKTINRKVMLCMLVLALSLSIVSALPNVAQTQPLAQTVETQTIGGDRACAAAWGLGAALALGAVSGCWVVCAALAWYDLAAIAAAC